MLCCSLVSNQAKTHKHKTACVYVISNVSSHLVVNPPDKNPIGDDSAEAGEVVGRAVTVAAAVVSRSWQIRGGGAAAGLRWTAGCELGKKRKPQ